MSPQRTPRPDGGLRASTVVLVGLVTAAAGYVVLRLVPVSSPDPFPATWASVILLLFMAAGILSAGVPIRRVVRGRSRRPVNPLRAVRVLILARASALTGALVAGWYVAVVLSQASDLDAASVQHRALRAGAVALSGLVLSGVGLWVQSMCRLDPPDASTPDGNGPTTVAG